MNQELQDFIEKQKQVITSGYEQAKNYTNIIMMGGYAGLFAIWSFTKGDLDKWQSLAVGLLALLSILSFVIFEIYGVWLRSTQTISLLKQLEEAKKLDKFPDDYGKAEMKRMETASKVWPFFFFFTLATGVLAGMILIYSFIEKLLTL
jgi:hypothetical protein